MPESKREINQEDNRQEEALSGALIAVGVIAVIEMLGLVSLDRPLTVSLYCFATSIPVLVLNILLLMSESHGNRFSADTWYRAFAFIFGSLFSLIGTGALFYHFSMLAGSLFTFVSFVGLVMVFHYSAKLFDANEPSKT